MKLADADPMTGLKVSIATTLAPLVILGIPKLTEVSRKVQTDNARANHLAQVARYHHAQACSRIEAARPLKRDDIIPNPVETSCYEIVISGQTMQFVYVVKDPETGLIHVASVFTVQELINQLSILNQP
jgi:hypothetical protein